MCVANDNDNNGEDGECCRLDGRGGQPGPGRGTEPLLYNFYGVFGQSVAKQPKNPKSRM